MKKIKPLRKEAQKSALSKNEEIAFDAITNQKEEVLCKLKSAWGTLLSEKKLCEIGQRADFIENEFYTLRKIKQQLFCRGGICDLLKDFCEIGEYLIPGVREYDKKLSALPLHTYVTGIIKKVTQGLDKVKDEREALKAEYVFKAEKVLNWEGIYQDILQKHGHGKAAEIKAKKETIEEYKKRLACIKDKEEKTDNLKADDKDIICHMYDALVKAAKAFEPLENYTRSASDEYISVRMLGEEFEICSTTKMYHEKLVAVIENTEINKLVQRLDEMGGNE
ncbi:MAG: hypothetical protein IKU60_05425 [Clostridia bacterium]|nr:hypothetical protein [Clostridia bacterium]